ncbi:MAG: zinc ribbon domain-containing protein [Lachnospiraceae bacterium]|nr:zinc ribbon domain-containing protein [Lachnospiraceae bacterium]
MYCIYCGRKLNDDAMFCPNCGKQVSGEIKRNVPNRQSTAQQNGQRNVNGQYGQPGRQPMYGGTGYGRTDGRMPQQNRGRSTAQNALNSKIVLLIAAVAFIIVSLGVFTFVKLHAGTAGKGTEPPQETTGQPGEGTGTDSGTDPKTKAGTGTNENDISLYGEVIEKLESEYGPLDINAYKLGGRPAYENACAEAVGLCYLALIDFDDDGTEELLAAAKHIEDEEYTVFVYTIEDGSVKNLIISDEMIDNFYDNYRNLYIKTNYAGQSFIDGGFGLDGWNYYKIFGIKDKEMGLISASSITESYNEETSIYEKQYYILDTPPRKITYDHLRGNEVTKEQYESAIDEWIWNYRYDYRIISLKQGLSEEDLAKGVYYDIDRNGLETEISNVKERVRNGEGRTGGQERTSDEGNPYSQYKTFVDDLINEYGEMRVSKSLWQLNDRISDPAELNGLCYLTLLDLDGSGSKELLAVYKEEHSLSFQGMIYSIIGGKAQRVEPVHKMEQTNNDISHSFMLRSNGERDFIIVYDGDYEDRGSYTTTIYGYIDGKIGKKAFSKRSGYPDHLDTYYIDDEPVSEEEFGDEFDEILGYSYDEKVCEYIVRGERSTLEIDPLKKAVSDTMDVINGTKADSEIDPYAK